MSLPGEMLTAGGGRNRLPRDPEPEAPEELNRAVFCRRFPSKDFSGASGRFSEVRRWWV